MTPVGRHAVVAAALVSILLGSTVPAHDRATDTASHHATGMAAGHASYGIDDACPRWTAASRARPKGPTRSFDSWVAGRQAVAVAAFAPSRVARIGRAVGAPVPLYDLHRVYRL